MAWWWTIREWLPKPEGKVIGPVRIAVVEASSWAEGVAFLEPGAERQVRELTTPDLVAEARQHGPGEVWEIEREKTPSAYDRFNRGGRIDFQAMEDEGFDVR